MQASSALVASPLRPRQEPPDAASPPSVAGASVAERLDRICSFLEQDDPNRRAAARRQLREQIGPEDIGELHAYIRRPLRPRVLSVLRARLRALVRGLIDALEARIRAFEAARMRARQLQASNSDAPEDLDALRAARAERERLRGEVHREHARLREFGLALSDALWEREQRGGERSPAVEKFRRSVRESLLDTAARAYPSPPAAGAVSPFEERALAPLVADLDRASPGTWDEFRERVARAALADLSSHLPEPRADARALFLQLGAWGRSRLRQWVEQGSAQSSLPPFLRKRIAAWNELGVPAGFEDRHALDLAGYASAPPRERLALLHRLEWVAGEEATPILVRLLSVEPEISLQVEAAAALARLGDPRGAEFLQRLGLAEAVALERVSRRVLLLEAIHRRESGELDRAIEELQSLARRFPTDDRIQYELAFTALRARQLDLAVQAFRRSLHLQPDNSLAEYNLACALALAGRIDEALDALESAVEDGFDDADHIAADPDLTALREQPRFRALLDRLRGDSG